MAAHTLSPAGVTFTLVELESCLDLVHGLVAAGTRWHSHVLSPVCMHNPYPGEYALVIEDDSNAIAYLARSPDGFPAVDKTFVRMLHGDDIIDAAKSPATPGCAATSSPLLLRLLELDSRRVAWHHHMHFPACQLSPQRGRWAIVIESVEGSFAEAYDDEPVDILQQIEVAYFDGLRRATEAHNNAMSD